MPDETNRGNYVTADTIPVANPGEVAPVYANLTERLVRCSTSLFTLCT